MAACSRSRSLRCSPGRGPLAFALRAQGKEVRFANLAFSDLNRLELDD
ncbi:hypothetical protein [Amycolatopsis tolypomycina]|nr:hypothetical protein [Amycolatopsis tolypomycina]